MNWSNFIYFALPVVSLWLTAGIIIYLKNLWQYLPDFFVLLGLSIYITFIIGFWIYIDRPPMKTMGETRLWYSLFLMLIGYLSYKRWKYPWMITFSSIVASVFVVINLAKPEIHSASLMPALQSIWFVPHVTSYILSYAMLGAATIAAIISLVRKNTKEDLTPFIDNMVYVGFGFLMLGLFIGAVWAKFAWGHYWSWDIKETWAFITANAYLIYIHIRLHQKQKNNKLPFYILIIAFVMLMITWLGVNYLPSAQGSVHVY